MIVLAIETSCDETGVALLRDAGVNRPPALLANLIASQEELHAPFGGIVPELASRRHLEALPVLVERALTAASLKKSDISGVAVTYAPGLVGALLVGVSFAKAYALALNIPFIGVHHIEGHLHAPFLEGDSLRYPFLALVVSGGHTSLYYVAGLGTYELIGATRDDAAGEAFDKVARILGLGYPGGPLIDKESERGDSKAFSFPRAKVGRFEFSFSGLKSSVKDAVNLQHHTNDSWLSDICASFQEAVVSELVKKTIDAAAARRCRQIVVSGGVARNRRLRQLLSEHCQREELQCFIPAPILCTDNAAMIGYVGLKRLQRGESGTLNLNAIATVELARAG